jgi:acetylornithine deacetylase/succinyl-diaminopimelate desuccinylase-like protein
MKRLESPIQLCQELVRIPSENPTGTQKGAGEAVIAEFVGEFLKSLGASIEFDEVAEGRPNVYGRLPAVSKADSTIMFAPHLDTVPVEGMTVAPFDAELRDGKIFGRGSSDTKGPMAAMLWALKTIDLKRLNVNLIFAGLADEESGQLGSARCASLHLADFVVVGEPTDLKTVYTNKGTAWIELEVSGVPAHASAPERGVNAIEQLHELFQIIKTEFPAFTQTHPVLGNTTISLGRIRGGSKVNVVPDRCIAEIDIRTLPGQENLVEQLQAFVATQKFSATVRPIKVAKPSYTHPENPFVTRLACCGAPLTGAPWFCDAAKFSEAGTPSVAIGPGSIAQAHTADEFIEVTELERGVEFFQKFLYSFSND